MKMQSVMIITCEKNQSITYFKATGVIQHVVCRISYSHNDGWLETETLRPLYIVTPRAYLLIWFIFKSSMYRYLHPL